jgi:3-oxoacyl-[acyl-carrier protein] reductase
METGLYGKVAIVTGASRGIGKAIASSLAKEGCRLVIVARGSQALNEAAEELRELGTEALALTADVTISTEIEHVVQQVVDTYGRVDVLVHNAGGARGQDVFDTSDEDWHAALALNVVALSQFARLLTPIMSQQGGGRIITLASIFGREAGGRIAYNAVKAALISLTKSLAIQLAPQNILVNSVAPGSILFPGGSWDRRVQADPAGMQTFVKNNLPLGRFGTPEEVAALVVFLASSQSSLITGSCITVDGAQSHSNI